MLFRSVVPFAAGGGTDAIGRVVAEKFAARLGQPVVVENKAGAASAIGTAYVAKAPADGYTLLMTTNSAMVILPLTQAAGSLNYDRADFSMIGLTGILPNLLIVSPKLPVWVWLLLCRLASGVCVPSALMFSRVMLALPSTNKWWSSNWVWKALPSDCWIASGDVLRA